MPKAKMIAADFGTHNLGFRHTTSTPFNMLCPIVVKELVAGDTVTNLSITGLNTLAPMPNPLNGDLNGQLRAFFVPMKVIWDKWDEYIGGLAAYTPPNAGIEAIKLAGHVSSSGEAHYNRTYLSQMGLPLDQRFYRSNSAGTGVVDLPISVLPLRAFQRIWWDWFRDSNVIPDSQMDSYIKKSTAVTTSEINSLATARFRAMPRNLFTTALRSPNGDSFTTPISSNNAAANITISSTTSPYDTPGALSANITPQNAGQYSHEAGMVSGTNIQNIRTANAIQRWLERANIFGGRVLDRLRGMTLSNASTVREDMSQYIGGSSYTINLETKETSTPSAIDGTQAEVQTPFGLGAGASMQGQKYTSGSGGMELTGLKFHADVAGYLVVINVLSPDFSYYQGIDRMYMRGVSTYNKSLHDFLDPTFSHQGYQPIYLAEVTGGSSDMVSPANVGNYTPLTVFGYSERYADYKYSKDMITGDLPFYAPTMQSWHLGRNLLMEAGIVKSNNQFVSGKTGSDIVSSITRDTISNSKPSNLVMDNKFNITTSDQDKVISDFKIKLDITRCIPAYVLPAIDGVDGATVAEIGGQRF